MRIRDKDFIDDRKEVTLDHEAEAPAFEYHDRIAAMSDAALRTAYLASDGCPGDPWIDALAQACQERGIDIEQPV